MPSVQSVLQDKGGKVHTIAPGATVAEAVQKMNEHKIGALVVKEGSHVIGMFTERDVLRRVVGEERLPARTIVAEVMTSDVVCCSPHADVDDVAATMQARRIRHIPVCDDDGDKALLGMISIGDVNACHASNQESTISFLNDYIYGRS